MALGLGATLLSAWYQDWTYDEPYHMQWSRKLLHEGNAGRDATPLYNSKTPITILNVLAKDAAVALGARGWARSFWARLPGFWYLATVAAVFVTGRRFFGERAALVAVAAIGVEPNLIANAALATVDAATACTTVLCLGAGVAYAGRPSLLRAALLGASLGLALAVKFTAFLLIPGLSLMPAVFAWRGRFSRSLPRLAGDALAAAAVSALVVNLAYLGDGFAEPLAAATWRSTLMTALAAAAPELRLPLPTGFLTGLDICLRHERNREWIVLVLGQRHVGGVWWYFLATGLFKTPILILAGTLWGWLRAARSRHLWRDPVLLALALNVALAGAYFSFFFRTQIHYRYALMLIPVVLLIAAAGWADLRRPGRLTAGTAVLLAVTGAESAPYPGNHLAFTNALVLRKKLAFRYPTNSIDLGQRDRRLRRGPELTSLEPLTEYPSHAQMGYNLIGLNELAGAASWRQHRWLRENLEPQRHVEHVRLLFHLDPAAFERFLDEDRRLAVSAAGERLCEPPTEGHPLEPGSAAAFPAYPEGAGAWVLCVDAPRGADLRVHVVEGRPALGSPRLRTREWDRPWPGSPAWYRLDPGRHALGVTRTRRAVVRWEARHGELELRLLPARILRGDYLRRLRSRGAVSRLR